MRISVDEPSGAHSLLPVGSRLTWYVSFMGTGWEMQNNLGVPSFLLHSLKTG